jgi:hypothetical protein
MGGEESGKRKLQGLFRYLNKVKMVTMQWLGHIRKQVVFMFNPTFHAQVPTCSILFKHNGKAISSA